MDRLSLVWRDRVLLLVGWSLAVWSAFNALVAGLAQPWERPLLGLIPPTPPAVITFWLIVAAASSLPFALLAVSRPAAQRRVEALQRSPAAFLALLLLFALLQLYEPAFPGEHLARAGAFARALILAGAALLLFLRREEPPLETLLLTGAWALLLGIARRTFPALPFDFAAAFRPDAATSAALVTAAVGQAVQIALLALPAALAIAPLRRRAALALGWLLAWPLWAHGALLGGPLALRAAYALLPALRLLTPIAVVRLGLMAATVSASVLAVRAIRAARRAPPRPVEISARAYRVGLASLALGYAALAVLLVATQYGYVNPDGYAYLKIARDYAAGSPVVRGYWAPLISWLLAPPIALGSDPQIAQRAQTALFGLGWVLVSAPLAGRFGLSRAARLAVAAHVAFLTLADAFTLVTPDLLGALVMAVYFYLVTSPRLVKRPLLIGALTGLVGGVAYLAKAYNLPFVLAHLALTGMLLTLHRQPVRRVAGATAIALAATILTVLPWVGLVSARYGHLTISTSGAISHALVGPQGAGHPCWDDRLCERPADVLFPWEDPLIEYYPGSDWSPLDDLASLDYQLTLARTNAQEWAQGTLLRLGALLPVALVSLAAAALVYWRDTRRRFVPAWLLLTTLLYAAGYMPVYASDFRYYYALIPLLAAGLYRVLDGVAGALSSLAARRAESTLLVLLVLAGPLLATADFARLTAFETHSACLRDDSAAFRPHLAAPTAGVEGAVINALAYYTGIRTYGGVSRLPDDPASVDAALREVGVATFVLPTDAALAAGLVAGHGYEIAAQQPLCGVEHVILRVPSGP